MPNNVTYREVKEMLQAYIDELKLHLSYADRILNKQMSVDDANTYFRNVLHVNLMLNESNIEKFRVTVLKNIRDIVDYKLRLLQTHIDKCNQLDDNTAIAVMNLAIQEFTFPLRQGTEMSKNNLSMEILNSLSRYEVLSSIENFLSDLRDDDFRLLYKYIHNKIELKPVQGQANAVYTVMNYEWNKFINEIDDGINKVNAVNYRVDPNLSYILHLDGWHEHLYKKLSSADMVYEAEIRELLLKKYLYLSEKTHAFLKAIVQAMEGIARQSDPERKDMSKVSLKIQHIKYFLSISNDFNEFKYFCSEIQKYTQFKEQVLIEAHRDAQSWEAIKKPLNKKFQKTYKGIHELKKSIDVYCNEMKNDNAKYGKLRDEIELLLVEVNNIGEKIKIFTRQYVLAYDKEYINSFHQAMIEQINNLQSRLKIIDEKYVELIRESKSSVSSQNANAPDIKANVKPLKIRDQSSHRKREADRNTNPPLSGELFAEMKRAESENFKRRLAKAREDRDQNKKRQLDEKLQKTTANNRHEPNTRVMDVKFRERIATMPARYFDILLSLFDPRKVVKYREICSLIVNHLGGRIEQVGNGSSHKRIRIEDCFAFMQIDNAHLNESSGEATKNDQEGGVTGGFFRQHGRSHQGAEMVDFNKEMVRNTLIRAGITHDLLLEIANERRNVDHRPH